MLSVNNISFGYYSTRKVISNLSLELTDGGVYGLLGKNGTGKSTLLYLIMGLLRPQEGTITFDGYDTSERNPDALQEMFIVPEEYNVPSIPLLDYVKALLPFYPNFDLQILKDCLHAVHEGRQGQRTLLYPFRILGFRLVESRDDRYKNLPDPCQLAKICL